VAITNKKEKRFPKKGKDFLNVKKVRVADTASERKKKQSTIALTKQEREFFDGGNRCHASENDGKKNCQERMGRGKRWLWDKPLKKKFF